jgi:hypothetical protein
VTHRRQHERRRVEACREGLAEGVHSAIFG